MRKTKIVTIEAEGRDKGKSFLITEMSAMQAEKWAAKALLALGRAGAEISDEEIEAGMLGILAAGLSAFRKMAFMDAEPLLDEMLECVAFVPDLGRKDALTQAPLTRAVIWGDGQGDADVEEVATLLTLRGEALEVHTGFSVAAALSNLAAAVQTSSRPATRTSRRSSERSSKAARRPSPNSRASTA